MAALRSRCGHYILQLWILSFFLMVALWNRADHYNFALSFLLSSFFFSSPDLSGRKLDVCHTSTQAYCKFKMQV